VDGAGRIAALRAAGADAFTIGSAVIDGAFAPGVAGVAAQIREILRCV
jgi:isopentenyl diphosphate isomerase/L-lactate dehydrogenase-like FMN-dependent dehydrogenase